MPSYRNLTGNRFGLLIVKEIFQRCPIIWTCQCDCGTIVQVRSGHLKIGKTRSCGCLRKIARWTGFEDISGDYFRSLRNGAESRNIEFTITIEEIWNQFIKQNKTCAYTQLPIHFRTGRKNRSQTASLDRINSMKGYIIGNIQWVHKDINRMKQNFTEKRFLELCCLVQASSNCSWSPDT